MHPPTYPPYTQTFILGTYVQIPVTEALELCTKSVLKPYNMFLKTVSCNVSFCVLQGQVSNVGGAVTYSIRRPAPYGYPGFGVGSEQYQKVS